VGALPDTAALSLRVETMLTQLRAAPQRREWIDRRDALQGRYQAAKEAVPKNRELVATLGIELNNLKDESPKLALSEEEYGTLRVRHGALAQQLVGACDSLVASEQYAALAECAKLLENLRAESVVAP
jgi:hypothetical protein